MLNIIKSIKEKNSVVLKGEKYLVLNEQNLKDILTCYRDKVEEHTIAKYHVKGYEKLDKDKLYKQEKEFIKDLFI